MYNDLGDDSMNCLKCKNYYTYLKFLNDFIVSKFLKTTKIKFTHKKNISNQYFLSKLSMNDLRINLYYE